MPPPRLTLTALCATLALHAQSIDIHIDAAKVTAHVSPALYGLMTEEINYSYDGGLYGELVRNRSFKEDLNTPVHWTLVQDHGGTGAIALDPAAPLNEAIATSLKLTVTAATGNQQVGIANDGFWGIPVKPDTRYLASFRTKAAPGFTGPLTVSITSNDGATVYATGLPPVGETRRSMHTRRLIVNNGSVGRSIAS